MPVNPSEDEADYVPTQILAELFKANGYDGIIYNSLFAEGKNIVLFDMSLAEVTNLNLVRVTNIPLFEFEKVRRISDDLAAKIPITPPDQKSE